MIEPQQWLVGEPLFLHPQHARFRFHGRFRQRDVIWHCDLYSLQHYVRSCLTPPYPSSLQQRLIITRGDDGRHDITVALRLPRIDRSAVYKTMVMVRNYRRLREGEHAFGPLHPVENANR